MHSKQFWVSAFAAVSLATGVTGHAQQPSATPGGAPDRVAAFKQSLQQGMAAIRRYQWVETTSISLKGEEKSRKQQACLYGADGKVAKTPIGQPAARKEAQGGGRRGGRVKQQIVEKKKDEVKDYMERAAALIRPVTSRQPRIRSRPQKRPDASRSIRNRAEQSGWSFRST